MSFARIVTAMITPFDAQGEVALDVAERLASWLVERGNDGLVICGTTGEGPTLSSDEKLAMFRAAKHAVGNRARIVANTGSNDTRSSVDITKEAEACGVDAVLAVVPYYNKPTQDGMLTHFGAIAQATNLPVFIYNIPGRSSVNMQTQTLLELARRHDNIAGVKESSGDFNQFAAILANRRAGFTFWCGDDHLYLPSLALGADGVVGVATHLCSREFIAMGEALRAGNIDKAAFIHCSLAPLFAALFATTSPIAIKWAMSRLGFGAGVTRSPLGSMPPELMLRLEPLLEPYREKAAAR
ncbi:MAG: 4-hydroxy-tetrahydrodipicolinate synthase [Candidatus Eremiobacteraeota bacterium]|nr:4-hydroxy-tetrahydrodipicolinate synthase [Candidatus Eremiobacteraeota bacterium]